MPITNLSKISFYKNADGIISNKPINNHLRRREISRFEPWGT